MPYTNGISNGVHHASDESIDSLYSFWPAPMPAPASLPEAAFSLTIEGRLDGQKCLLTARGQTPDEFRRNVAALKGLLDPVLIPAGIKPSSPTAATGQPDPTPQCPQHGLMKASTKAPGTFHCTKKLPSGSFCTERFPDK
jgi:hypothetical protein